MHRREFISVLSGTGLAGIAGCLHSDDNSNEIQDTDGDGVIDSEDYAPRDPDVQSIEDVENSPNSNEQTPSDSEQSQDGQSESDESDDSEDSDTSSQLDYDLVFDWEDGTKSGWRANEPRYDDYRAEFNVVSHNPISGNYSAQTIALNNRITVDNPTLPDQIISDNVSTVRGKFRLEGDLDASDQNHNGISIEDKNQNLAGRLLFYHGGNEIRWNTGTNPAQNHSPRVLRQFNGGEVYEINIDVGVNSFTVSINGDESQNLPSASGTAEVGQLTIDSRNSTGYGDSLYDSPIYFTWDDISLKFE